MLEIRQVEYPLDDRPNEHCRAEVKHDIYNVVTDWIEPPEAVIQSKRQVDQRTRCRRPISLWIQGPALLRGSDERPKCCDGRVADHRILIVENEWALERAPIDSADHGRQN